MRFWLFCQAWETQISTRHPATRGQSLLILLCSEDQLQGWHRCHREKTAIGLEVWMDHNVGDRGLARRGRVSKRI
jgi:hypothetical protein